MASLVRVAHHQRVKRWLGVLIATVAATVMAAAGKGGLPGDLGATVDLQALALVNGGRLADGPDRATLRLPGATAIVFDGSNRVLVNGVDVTLDGPVIRRAGVWTAPSSLAGALNLRLPESPASVSTLAPLFLNWERLELGRGAPALHLFLRAPKATSDDASLVLADLDQLAKANPTLRASVRRLHADFPGASGRLVYFSIIADRGVALPATINFRQNGQMTEEEPSAGLRALEGRWPGPSLGVLIIPPSYSLHAPLTVTWGQATGTLTLRP